MKRENLKEFKILSQRLFNLREANKYSQMDVALRVNISYQSYQAYEYGKAVPSLQTFIKLAKLYNVSLDYLIGKN